MAEHLADHVRAAEQRCARLEEEVARLRDDASRRDAEMANISSRLVTLMGLAGVGGGGGGSEDAAAAARTAYNSSLVGAPGNGAPPSAAAAKGYAAMAAEEFEAAAAADLAALPRASAPPVPSSAAAPRKSRTSDYREMLPGDLAPPPHGMRHDRSSSDIYKAMEVGDMVGSAARPAKQSAPPQLAGGGAGGGGGGGDDDDGDKLPAGNPFNMRSRTGPAAGSHHYGNVPVVAPPSPSPPAAAAALDLDVESKPFFFGPAGRSDAQAMLTSSPAEHYLFRECGDPKELIGGKRNPNLFVLTFVDGVTTKNIKIYRFPGEGLSQTRDRTGPLFRSVEAVVRSIVDPRCTPFTRWMRK